MNSIDFQFTECDFIKQVVLPEGRKVPGPLAIGQSLFSVDSDLLSCSRENETPSFVSRSV